MISMRPLNVASAVPGSAKAITSEGTPDNSLEMNNDMIRADVAKRELDAIHLNYPHLKNFIDNKELHGEIARIAIDRTEMNLEDSIVSCGDLFFSLIGKKTEKEMVFSYPRLEVERICRGVQPSFIHFHGPYLGYQSDSDAETNKFLLNKDSGNVNMGCATGIDGIHCQTWTHSIRIPWSDKFYQKLKNDRGWNTFKDVKSVTCSKNKKRGVHVSWSCDMRFKDGKGNHVNIYDEVNLEHSKMGDNLPPYTVLEDKEDKFPFPKYYNETYEDGDDISCTLVENKKNSKRLLTCFKTSW